MDSLNLEHINQCFFTIDAFVIQLEKIVQGGKCLNNAHTIRINYPSASFYFILFYFYNNPWREPLYEISYMEFDIQHVKDK